MTQPANRRLATEAHVAAAVSGVDSPIDSVNGKTGAVVLNADDIADGTTNHAFTAVDDTKLAGIATGATANRTDSATDTLLAAKAPLASPAFTGTPTGITKTHVGLGNVDNTSDANKPVSTAQATAITAAKARANHTGTQAATTITGLATVATSGAYTDLTGKPQHTTVTVDGVYQPTVELPSTPVSAADVGAIPIEARGAVDGVASLDGTGKVPSAQLPITATRAPAVNMSGIGLYTTPVVISTNTLPMALDTVYACPLAFDVAVTLDLIGLRVTTASSADNVLQLGLFASSGGRPSGAPLVRVTATPSSANSAVEWAISQALAAGIYWLEISSHVGTAPTVRAGTLIGQMALDASAIASSAVQAALIQSPYTTTTALPNPLVTSGTAPLMPRIYVRRSA